MTLPPNPSPPDTSPEDLAWITPRRRWQPVGTFAQSIALKGPAPKCPRTYIYCTRLPPGDPFGHPNAGIPPSGMPSPEQHAWMVGPSLPAQNAAACRPYMFRQQIGHFLYLIDRGRREVVVFNSNDMRVIDRIPLPVLGSLSEGGRSAESRSDEAGDPAPQTPSKT